MTHSSVASSKPELELDSHADTCVVGDKCFIIHKHDMPINIYSHDQKDGHGSAKSVNNDTVGYHDP